MENLDITLYDRQMRTFGLEASKKIHSGIIYIYCRNITLYSISYEILYNISKNLALSGINMINFINFIDSDYKIKKYINDLNSMVVVNYINDIEDMKENSCILFINIPIHITIDYNIISRKKNCKLVYVVAGGLCGSIFVDANTHIVSDLTGEIKNITVIKEIHSNGKIICDEHNFSYGDMIQFTNMNGVNINYLTDNIFKVIDTTQHSLTIINNSTNIFEWDDTMQFINGSIKYINTTTTITHKPLYDINIPDIVLNMNKMLTTGRCDEKNIQFTFSNMIYPAISLISGIASTEIIKLISCKYTPIEQWYIWSDFDIIKDYSSIKTVNNELKYIMNKLNDSNILLVGCGAIGCEWLHNMVKMSSHNTKMSIDIVDPDHIEKSNLSRQLLFRSHHVGKSKCLTAIDTISKLNPNIKCVGYEQKLINTDIEFTNKVFKNKDIIISALDNIEARKYVDMVCFDKCLPLFESGTMGMKCNTQPIIPFITDTYGSSTDPDTDKQYPVCTIKHFPNSIQHTIHWARDYFELFNRGPLNCNKYIENNKYLDNIPENEKKQAIEDINYFLSDYPNNWTKCCVKAFNMYEEQFNHNIKQLLEKYPQDHMIDDKLFWSNGKLCPQPLEINMAYPFIESTTHILCQIYNIPKTFTPDDLKTMINSFKISDYKLKSDDINITLNDNILSNSMLIPMEFEKDVDTNWHINWLTSASNTRAQNYGIMPVSNYETKGIAGRIIPAIATTTATVVGMIGLELLRYLNNTNDISKYRSWFANMADNTYIYSEPIGIMPIIIGETKLNGWTKFKYTNDNTLKDFIDYINKTFNIEPNMILYETSIIYSEYTSNKMDINLSELFKITFNINIIGKEIPLTILSDIEIPTIILAL